MSKRPLPHLGSVEPGDWGLSPVARGSTSIRPPGPRAGGASAHATPFPPGLEGLTDEPQ
jgi:hypothetical protein